MREVVLDEVADVRAGDKGDTLLLVVVPRSPELFAALRDALTPAVVAAHFAVDPSAVACRSAPGVGAVVCTLKGALGGGVTGSTLLDGHGKTLSYHMLGLRVRLREATDGRA